MTGWILELDRGRGIPYEGNYSSWLEQKQKRLAQEGREDEAHKRTIEREREWVSASPKARQAKSKARIQRYEDLVAKANEKGPTTAQIVIPIAERLGNNVIEFEDLKKAFGDKLLIDGLSFKLPPGGIVGVIGPNGAGKTTLFRMITGQEQPDEGSIKIGETVKLGYVDQSRDSLDANKTLYEEISGGNEILYLGKREINARAYCGAFNFKGADQQKKVGVLSGGERNRVHLAKILKSGANVLLLDEPTNDLDVDTLRALEEALEDYAGCAVIIIARSLVPRPHRHPHPRLRGRQPRRVVRGQLRRLRGGQEAPPRHGFHDPAPDQVQEVLAVSRQIVRNGHREGGSGAGTLRLCSSWYSLSEFDQPGWVLRRNSV